MSEVALKNLLRQPRAFNLEHPFFRQRKGANGLGKPEVLSMRPRETVRGLPEEVLMCAEVQAALRATEKRQATLRRV